ncbi:MAG: hypothetical protein ACYC10_11035 [Allorhizobium sp.]
MDSPEKPEKSGWLDRLLRTLARLGILRYGAKAATYTSARDRPTEFLMPGVFDAKRDLASDESSDQAKSAGKSPDERKK